MVSWPNGYNGWLPNLSSVFDSPKGIICDSLVAIKLVFKSDGRASSLIVQINSAKFLTVRGASRHPVFTDSCLTISICVCSTYLVNEKVFVLLMLLKEMRTLAESEIFSFFVYGVSQGR